MATEVSAGRSILVDGQTVRVLDEGAGPPILLLHGFPDRAEMWRYVSARLRDAGRRTIAVDLPGMGESSAPIGAGITGSTSSLVSSPPFWQRWRSPVRST